MAGRFDLFDAWKGSLNLQRAQIARGQELFNNVNSSGRQCRGCHNAANNGQNVGGTLFDIGTSRRRPPQGGHGRLHPAEPEQRADPGDHRLGPGGTTGLWNDVDRFKTPNLRGLASRGPFFHNGIAATLHEVVRFYEEALGFEFTGFEEADLVAFLSAL